MNEIQSLIKYIAASPAAPQAAQESCRRLEAAGYTLLREDRPWELVSHGKYYVRRGQTALIAFRVPEELPTGVMIVASHGDSPSFSVTPGGTLTVAGKYTRLTVEKYGGMLCATWLDRPLSVAGVVSVRTADGVETRPVTVDRDLVVIPSVAIHMNRAANENAAYNPAVDMQPLFGDETAVGGLADIVAEAAGVTAGDIVSWQLWLYNRQAPVLYGAKREFIGSARLDDLECASAALDGFLAAADSTAMPVYVLFDNEEVGSATVTGADSDFLAGTLKRISRAFAMNEEEYRMMLSRSFLVSADNAHAQHPNHPEYADATHAPRMNGGVVIKHNANRRYATDATSAAVFAEICRRAGVPTQHYTNRADIPGGSTLGCIGVTQLSVPTVDIGLAQLAMHSAFETAGVEDYAHMVNALAAFYGSALYFDDRGGYVIDMGKKA